VNKLSWYQKKDKVLTGWLKKTSIDNPMIIGSNEPIIGGWKTRGPEIPGLGTPLKTYTIEDDDYWHTPYITRLMGDYFND